MTDPFFITGPAIISFSGGRTSAYMLWRILQAHGGVWPDDVHVVFANTGKERLETLRFISECARRWDVNVIWTERGPDGECLVVGDNSASREGEPFAALIQSKGFVPNRGAGYCSIELKGRVIRDYAKGVLGWKNWTSVIGLRYDEQDRVFGALNRNKSKKDPWRNAMPLNDAKVTRREVLTFWLGPKMDMAAGDLPQGFDLGLYDYEGNCDLCWKKSRPKRLRTIRDNPGAAEWWAQQEESTASTFDLTDTVRRLAQEVDSSPVLPMFEEDEHDAECGSWC